MDQQLTKRIIIDLSDFGYTPWDEPFPTELLNKTLSFMRSLNLDLSCIEIDIQKVILLNQSFVVIETIWNNPREYVATALLVGRCGEYEIEKIIKNHFTGLLYTFVLYYYGKSLEFDF